jgi:hypothetical protein
MYEDLKIDFQYKQVLFNQKKKIPKKKLVKKIPCKIFCKKCHLIVKTNNVCFSKEPQCFLILISKK